MHNYSNTDFAKLQEKKKLSVQVAKKLYGVGLLRVSNNILNCANYSIKQVCPDCGEVHQVNLMYCRERLCPLCQYKRSLKIKKMTMDIANRVEEVNPGLNYLLLTLTVRNCYGDELSKTIDKLLNAWKFLTDKRKRFKKIALGYVRTLEVTYNVARHDYHPHLHIILAVPGDYFENPKLYLSHNEIAEHWRTAIDINYKPIIDVRAITPSGQRVLIDETAELTDDIIIQKLTKRELEYNHAISEVCKYAVKFNYDAAPGVALKTLYESLYGRRLIGYGGIFRSAKRELLIPNEEEVTPDDDLNILQEQVCKSCAGNGLKYELLRFDVGASVYTPTGSISAPERIVKEYCKITGEFNYDDDFRTKREEKRQ